MIVNILFKKLSPMYNETMNELFSAGGFSKSEIVQDRLKLVEFSKNYGIKATRMPLVFQEQ